MAFDRHDVQLVALTLEDGSLAVMQFITRAWNSLAEDIPPREREATDEAIEQEIAKLAVPQRVVSWRRIRPEDLPTDRTHRDAWRDDGAKIAVDPARVTIRPLTIEQRIAKLEAEVSTVRPKS